MTIDRAYQILQLLFNKQQNGNIAPSQFNAAAPVAQMSVINKILGNEQEYTPGHPVARYGIGLTQKIMEDLGQLISTPQSLSFSSGIATYPTSSLYLYTMVDAQGYIIKPVQHDEAVILNQSVIKPPIVNKAIYYVLGTSIYILPSSITTANVSYVKIPTDPYWNYTITNNSPVYNSSGSQDFSVGPMLQLRVILVMAQMFGLNLNLADVVQVSQALEHQGA